MSREIGNLGERIAVQYLENAGYVIVQQNYRSPSGEIDIIAFDGAIHVLFEVKSRASTRKGEPEEAVTPKKIRHMFATASDFFAEKGLDEFPEVRFDMLAIRMTHTMKVYSITHVAGLEVPNES